MTATLERPHPGEPIVARAGRRRGAPRLSLALVAVMVAALSALGFVAWARSLGARTDVIVARRDVPPGAVITRDDLEVARIAGGRELRAVPASSLRSVVGRIASGPIPHGALVNPDMVSDAPVLAPGRAVVGVAVRSGQAPLGELVPGLAVMVVRTPPSGASESDATILASSAVVQSVSRPDSRDRSAAALGNAQYVSLEVPIDVAPDVAAASAGDRVRLVLVSPR